MGHSKRHGVGHVGGAVPLVLGQVKLVAVLVVGGPEVKWFRNCFIVVSNFASRFVFPSAGDGVSVSQPPCHDEPPSVWIVHWREAGWYVWGGCLKLDHVNVAVGVVSPSCDTK